MKTQSNTKLDFKKESISELNDNQLKGINGGSSQVCIAVSVAHNLWEYLAENLLTGDLSFLDENP